MAEGSDGAGSEMEENEIVSESREGLEWSVAGERILNRKKRKKLAKEVARKEESDFSISNSEAEQNPSTKQKDESKVFAKLTQIGASFGEWNPIRLTNTIHKALGEIKDVKVLRNGSLLIFCKNGAQQAKALRINRIGGKEVVCSMPERAVRGVLRHPNSSNNRRD